MQCSLYICVKKCKQKKARDKAMENTAPWLFFVVSVKIVVIINLKEGCVQLSHYHHFSLKSYFYVNVKLYIRFTCVFTIVAPADNLRLCSL